jgi:hypothetical protein
MGFVVPSQEDILPAMSLGGGEEGGIMEHKSIYIDPRTVSPNAASLCGDFFTIIIN